MASTKIPVVRGGVASGGQGVDFHGQADLGFDTRGSSCTFGPVPQLVEEGMSDSADRTQRLLGFYERLLRLGHNDAIDVFLHDALEISVELASAERGYLQIGGEEGGAPMFWSAKGCSDEEVEAIRNAFSRGVIAEALATGKIVITASALTDERFKNRKSVRRNKIEAVLCAPIGSPSPIGVLYLQGRTEPGPFTEADRDRAEMFARHAAPFVELMLLRRKSSAEGDPTLPYRKQLRCANVIGKSAALARVLKQAAMAAPLDVSVLLLGPNGTGKTQLASVIHKSGPRADAPFVEVQCAGMPDGLVESELFGAEAGAHSTATQKKIGKVAAAERGTLFLDEIGEMSLQAQGKLLHLVQAREYTPLGSSKPVRANIRLIAATNKDLKAAVAAQQFREDLFYRLHVMPITLPSLAERPEDITEIAVDACARAIEQHSLHQVRMSPGALRAIATTEWPGNVRQLEHAVEVAAITASAEGVLQVEPAHLFPDRDAPSSSEVQTLQAETYRFQKKLVQRVLDDTGWKVTEAARKLDIARQYLHELIKAFGLKRPRA